MSVAKRALSSFPPVPIRGTLAGKLWIGTDSTVADDRDRNA
jgi:hypothetical protein